MNTKSKRPSVFGLDNFMVTSPPVAAAPIPEEAAPEPAPPIAKTPKNAPEVFRTSVYFSRAVHDKLRAIAFEERKTVTDLINEGLDHVLSSRNFPSTAELRQRES